MPIIKFTSSNTILAGITDPTTAHGSNRDFYVQKTTQRF